MKKEGLIQSLILAVEKVIKKMKGEYTCIIIEKDTFFSNYKIEIRKD